MRKKAVKIIDGLSIHPDDYKSKVNAIFSEFSADLLNAYQSLRSLVNETNDLISKS